MREQHRAGWGLISTWKRESSRWRGGEKYNDMREQHRVGRGREAHKGNNYKTNALVKCLSKKKKEVLKIKQLKDRKRCYAPGDGQA